MNERKPRFSIVMPTFKRGHVIGRAVESIRHQTFTDWELIVVDNAGPGYRFDDDRIRCHVHAEPRGSSHARNHGIAYIRGDLACFFDDDDVMNPQYLATFHRVFQDPEVMMARCGMRTGARRDVIDCSFATPEVVVRSEYVTPTWASVDCHDQRYFRGLVSANGWRGGQIVEVREVLVEAMTDPVGGMRDAEGGF